MSPHMVSLDIALEDSGWSKSLSDVETLINTCLEAMMDSVPETKVFGKFSTLEISVLLTGNEAIQTLNRDYRGKDKPTNVLSFPSLGDEEIKAYFQDGATLPDYPVSLGDIIFSLQTLEGEARAQNKDLADHFCHLFIHGLLHLLGYDHVQDRDAEHMEALEKAILGKLAIDDPYEA